MNESYLLHNNMTIKTLISKYTPYINIFLLATALGFALFLQYVMNVIPCKLCYYQRYFFYGILATNLLQISTQFNKIKYLTFVLIIANLLLSLYQSGLELGIVPDLFHCSADFKQLKNFDDILKQSPLTNCAIANFHLFGLTLSNYSLLLNIILFSLWFKRQQKNAK